MASYIDVDSLNVSDYIEVWECNCSENGRQVVMAVDDLLYLPTVDVQEVKHGKWIPYQLAKDDERYGYGDNQEEGKTWYKCSVCEIDALGECCNDEFYSYPRKSDYCPHCGAKMDKE